MRFSTVFISSAFVLASMTVALPTERENMLLARFADSGFLAEVEARAYGKESELYAMAHHRDHDTRETPFPINPRPNPPTNGHPNGHLRLRRSNVSPNQVEARAYGEESELYAMAHHRDHDTRETPFPINPRPNPPTNGHPNGHLRLRRSNVSPNQVEARAYGEESELYAMAHHRDHDTRETPFPINPRPNPPTNGHPNGHTRLRRSVVSPNQVEARAYDEEAELYARQRVPNGPHRDHDTRDWWMVPVTDSRPNQPTEPTNGHPRPGLRRQ